MDRPSPEKLIHGVINRAETQLVEGDPTPFSVAAFAALKHDIARYIMEIVNESIKVSKRHRADTVSAAHVEHASQYLVSNTSRRFFRHLGTLGGILLGASLSNFLAMTIVSQYRTSGTLLSAGLGIIGAFMIALHIAKE